MCKYRLGVPDKHQQDAMVMVQDSQGGATELSVIDIKPNAFLKIHHIDVGQGEATLFTYYRFGELALCVLIDGGLVTRGGTTVLCYLKRLGIEVIHAMICTHYDADHIGGLIRVLESGADYGVIIDHVFERSETQEHETITKFRNAAKKHAKKLLTLKKGESLGHVSEQEATLLKIVCLAVNNEESLDENNASIALRAELGKFTYFLAGDLESESEVALINEHVCAFKCGHHGSNYSTSAILDKMKPTAAFISCGHQNYGHPGIHTLRRLLACSTLQHFYLTTCHYNRIGVNPNWFSDEILIACKMLQRAIANLEDRANKFLSDEHIGTWFKLAFAYFEFVQYHGYFQVFADAYSEDTLLRDELPQLKEVVNTQINALNDFIEQGFGVFVCNVGVEIGEHHDEGSVGTASKPIDETNLELMAEWKMRGIRDRLRGSSIWKDEDWQRLEELAWSAGVELAVHYLKNFTATLGLVKGFVAGDSDHLGMNVLTVFEETAREHHEFTVEYHCSLSHGTTTIQHACHETAKDVDNFGHSKSSFVNVEELGNCIDKSKDFADWTKAIKNEREYQRFTEPTWLKAEPKAKNPMSNWEYEDQIGLHDEEPVILRDTKREAPDFDKSCLLCEKELDIFDDGKAKCKVCKSKYTVHYKCWAEQSGKSIWQCPNCKE
jgi:competence protein ComEC